ncbi:hypothetical protein Vafri_9941, partial [Volvox africanus]
ICGGGRGVGVVDRVKTRNGDKGRWVHTNSAARAPRPGRYYCCVVSGQLQNSRTAEESTETAGGVGTAVATATAAATANMAATFPVNATDIAMVTHPSVNAFADLAFPFPLTLGCLSLDTVLTTAAGGGTGGASGGGGGRADGSGAGGASGGGSRAAAAAAGTRGSVCSNGIADIMNAKGDCGGSEGRTTRTW